MASFALIKGSTVVNIVEWSGDRQHWSPPSGHECVPALGARIGDTWDGQAFATPPRLEPEPVVTDVDRLIDLLRTKNVITATDRDALRAARGRP